ncbi:MAG: sugar phosphate isomerase/epimerase, partial [Paracoccaceae bacterium]
MAFSKLGAAITLDVQEEVINWLCDANRPIEVQDFTSPNLLNSDFSDLVLKYKDKLKSHTGTKGLHGPFFGLDLGNQETEFQKLISKRLLTALDICEQLSAEYMVIHSPFDDWINLN